LCHIDIKPAAANWAAAAIVGKPPQLLTG